MGLAEVYKATGGIRSDDCSSVNTWHKAEVCSLNASDQTLQSNKGHSVQMTAQVLTKRQRSAQAKCVWPNSTKQQQRAVIQAVGQVMRESAACVSMPEQRLLCMSC